MRDPYVLLTPRDSPLAQRDRPPTLREMALRMGVASTNAIRDHLRVLETKGYLKSWLAEPTAVRGGRAKRFYALRPRAVAALRDSRRALLQMWRGVDELLERT